MTEDGAARHLDELASKYAGRPIRYFGDAIPAPLRRDRGPRPVPDPARPTSSRSTPAGQDATDDAPGGRRRSRSRSDPGLAPGPADPADLRRAHDDGRPTASPSRAWCGSTSTASARGSTRRSSDRRGATCSPTRRSACSSSTPTTPAPLHPDPRRCRARHGRGRRAPRRADPPVHAVTALLRVRSTRRSSEAARRGSSAGSTRGGSPSTRSTPEPVAGTRVGRQVVGPGRTHDPRTFEIPVSRLSGSAPRR